MIKQSLCLIWLLNCVGLAHAQQMEEFKKTKFYLTLQTLFERNKAHLQPAMQEEKKMVAAPTPVIVEPAPAIEKIEKNEKIYFQSYTKRELSLAFVEAVKNHENLSYFLHHKIEYNKQDGQGKTALMYAAEQRDVALVKLLLQRGAKAFSIKDSSKNKKRPYGMCAFDYAGDDHALRTLLWQEQIEDRALRNADIMRRDLVMGPVYELLRQPMPHEDLYV